MSLAIIAPGGDRTIWLEYFKKADPSLKVEVWPEIEDVNEVTCAMTWKHPLGDLKRYPSLQLICSMGAGVDHIFRDPDLPSGVPITKVVDKHLSRDMSNYVINAVINYQRDFIELYQAQEKAQWLTSHRWPKQLSIGIFGMGTLGQDSARKLTALEFEVHGFSRSKKTVEGVHSYHGSDQLDQFLKAINVLVCMMPLTAATRGILNKDLFKKLNHGTYLINVARGEHIVDEDLIQAIDEGIISGALLDVFHEEPLPLSHPFWTKKEIVITPHNASVTDPVSVTDQIVANYRKIETGERFDHLIDLLSGY